MEICWYLVMNGKADMLKQSGWMLFVAGILMYATIAIWQRTPGYMDAEYYYVGGRILAEGEGFWEPFLWNYLDNPSGLPHPAFTYWMPLPALLAALGMMLAKNTAFLWARLPFLLLGAATVPLTAWLAGRLNAGSAPKKRSIWLSGGLALFGGFYVIYNGLTETFVLYFVLGALFLVAGFENFSVRLGWWRGAVLGGLAGLMHLTRADGVLWLFAGVVILIWQGKGIRQRVAWLLGLLAVYGLLISPWMVRNLEYYGSPFSSGGSRTLWLTNYDQTFVYPADQLTFQNWLNSGAHSILAERGWALGMNLRTTLGVQGSVFLLPLIVIGLWMERNSRWAQFVVGMWLVTLLTMTIAFPFAGARGGFFHSGTALQAAFWAVVPRGLDGVLMWASRWRGWSRKQAGRFFSVGLVGMAAFFTVVVVNQQLIGWGMSDAVDWQRSWTTYEALDELDLPIDAIFMVNNPPGFYAVTGWSAVVIPNGDVEMAVAAAQRYGVDYLILDRNAPMDLRSLYEQPESRGDLIYIATIADQRLFAFAFLP